MLRLQLHSQSGSVPLVPHKEHAAFVSSAQPYAGPDRRCAFYMAEPKPEGELVLNASIWVVIVASLILDVLAVIGACHVWKVMHG